ncbi:MAG: NADH dehydrogenase (quinone) subunit D [Fidelibacterota bacterium]
MIESPKISTQTMTLNFGPSHPATHGTLRIVMELDGETIIKIVPHIGFLHTGFEKLGENMSYNQFITVTDRMNYISPLNNNIGFALAVEKLLGLEIPPRAQYIRVIMAELSRISDHLLCTGMQALDIGAFTVFLYCFREREKLYDLFEWITGTRLTTSYTRIGGLASDFPDGVIPAIRRFIRDLPGTINEIEALLSRNRIWLERTKGVGVITEEDAISYGITGPCMRASGIQHDLRKAEPYSSYGDFNFDIPVGENGDVYDRYLVRIEEIRQSLRIVEQAVDKLPSGEINLDSDSKVTLPKKGEVYSTIEGLIYHFEIIMKNRGFGLPEGEVYMATESPNGELGFYIISNGKREPYRIHIRPPSLLNYGIFPKLLEGSMISDAVAVLGSLNIIAGELDR